MALNAGEKLGPYEITALIGKGGMGEVYRARDPRLNRDVAIKVSARQFSERFAREAQAIAKLNHPNICTLYDVGPNYLVMEFVEGANPKGPLPEATVLDYARQMASALDEAHENGVTHRDLKPGNIVVRPDGVLKILDFGLAKIQESTIDPAEAETVPAGMTAVGAIIGTPAYMSPEQARGKNVDKRTDLWAFGVILYELSTGDRLFNGDTMADVIAQVVTKDPDLSKVPAQLKPLITKCLERDPRKRLRDAGDATTQLEPRTSPSTPARTSKLPWLIAAGAILAAGVLVVSRPKVEPPAVMRFSVLPGDVDAVAANEIAVAPDGKKFAFVVRANGKIQLWLRSLDNLTAKPLAEMELLTPTLFWSPDSTRIGFNTTTKLKKVDIASGNVETVCDINGTVWGATWGSRGTILFSNGSIPVIMKVRESGGTPTQVTEIIKESGETSHNRPVFLPDGNHFLFNVSIGASEGIASGEVEGDPHKRSSKPLVVSPDLPFRFAPDAADPSKGRILYLRGDSLMAQSISLADVRLLDEPVLLAEGVGSQARVGFFGASISVLAYRAESTNQQLAWFDFQGKALARVPGLGNTAVALSPSGTSAITTRSAGSVPELWHLDLDRGTSTRFLATSSANQSPVWSPDGKQIAFSSVKGLESTLFRKDASGAGPDVAIDNPTMGIKSPSDWSRDGKYLAYTSTASDTGADIWILPLQGSEAERKPIAFANTITSEGQAHFSPDTKYVAYVSTESGTAELFVRTFPQTTGQWSIVRNGVEPSWSNDGKRLYYRGLRDNGIYEVPIEYSPAFHAGPSKLLFVSNFASSGGASRNPRWTVAPDGKRFFGLVTEQTGDGQPITVVVNWQSSLK